DGADPEPDPDGPGPDGRGPDGPGGPGGGAPEPDPRADTPTNGTAPQEPADEPRAPARGRAGGDGPTHAAPPPSTPFRARRLEVPGIGEGAPGRRSRARTDTGRIVRPTHGTPR